ncbi:MAG: hypothetical protein WA952_04515 [Lewinella sp.]
MSEMDNSSIEMNFGAMSGSVADSTENSEGNMGEVFQKISEAFGDVNYVTTLSNGADGVVNIVMTTQPKDSTKAAELASADGEEAGLMELMQAMNQGVRLRGSVYDTGDIHSFWVKRDQKNLIATLFQLPTSSVKIGDKWSVDVSLISNDANFRCDSSYRINEVTLTDIREANGETVAVIQYNIVEYVKGEFSVPMFADEGGKSKTEMEISHQAKAEFSVDAGRWITYDGIMSIKSTGIVTADKKTKFTLTRE